MPDADLDTRTRHLLEESTQHADDTLHADLYLRDIEGWDSMGMVMFIGLVKERLGIELTVHDLSQRETVAELCTLVGTQAPARGPQAPGAKG